MIVVDANVVIALLDADDAHHRATFKTFEQNAHDEIAASALTIAETLVRPARDGLHGRVAAALDTLGIRVLPITGSDAALLAELRATHGIRMPDAVVLHAAVTAGAQLMTFDGRLAAAARATGVPLVPQAG